MNVIEEIKSKEYYLNFTIISSYFCVFLDFTFYLITSFALKSKNNSLSLLKYRLFILFIVDIIIRISFIKTYFLVDSLAKELILTLLSSCKFYIILSLLEEIIKKIKNPGEESNLENLESFQKSSIFFFIIFSYEKFTKSFTKEIILIENLAFLGYIFKIYPHIRNKVCEIFLIIKIRNQKTEINFKEYMTLIPLIILIVCYCLKIFNLFIEDRIIFFDMNILIIIIKEVLNNIIYIFLCKIIFSLDDNLFMDEKSNISVNTFAKLEEKNKI